MTALNWPEGFDRTPAVEREPYPHGFDVTQYRAFKNIIRELERMDVQDRRIETTAKHTVDEPWRPYKDANPEDPGVVVYWTKAGKDYAAPCDRWDNLRDNAQAIYHYLDAKRGMDRWGVETVESEFTTQALPSADNDVVAAHGRTAHDILGIEKGASNEEIKAAYKERLPEVHPDHGGTDEAFMELREAKEALLE